MKKIFTKLTALCFLFAATTLQAQQLPDPHFEDWSDSFNGDAQPKYWHGSNVEQVGFKFTFLYQKDGRTGKCAYVADKKVGAFGITEIGPGYFGLGYAWQKLEGVNTSSATAGTYGGISFTYRPDSMVVWIKRTGPATGSEDFHLLFYSWRGKAVGTAYKNKAGECTEVTMENEESDIRVALDGNECTTKTAGEQVAEGWYRARAKYESWTRMSVPIYYNSDATPTMCNVIFSAGNYPNFRANSGLNADNALYVDDVELIYSNKIQQLFIGNVRWGGFDPNSSDVQEYSLGDSDEIPAIVAKRGVGTLTNAKGKPASFVGRTLGSDELTIKKGKVGDITTLTVTNPVTKSTRTYKIRFVKEASKNTKLAGISVNGENIGSFSPNTFDYTYELPYGTEAAPVVTVEKQEEVQTVAITQATSVTGTAKIVVTSAAGTTSTYNVTFKVAQLKDNSLKDILVDGQSLPGFIPSQTIYKLALPLETTTIPVVTAVSPYPDGAQTIVVHQATQLEGGKITIEVSTPGNPVPRVYTLNIKLEASTYTKLKELHMQAPQNPLDPTSPVIDYITDFSPDIQTYYVILPKGTTTLPEVTYVQGDKYQTVTVQYGGLDGTTNIIVKAASGAQMAYTIVIQTLKSNISTLNNLIVTGNGELKPEFSPTTYKYTYSLPDRSQGLPTISWVPGDEFQKVDTVLGGLNETSRINVTAGDGSVSTYQIYIEVAKSSVSHLNGITLDGQLIPGWDKDVLEYTKVLEKDDPFPVVAYTKAEDVQIVNEKKITAAPGDYKLTVIAENGTKRQYVIHFRLNLSSDATLKTILLNNTPMSDFQVDKLEYTITLPAGSATPKVEAVTRDGQTIVPSKQGSVYTYLVTAEDKITTREYKVTIIIQKSENAYLKDLQLDGTTIANWNPKTLEYDYTFDGAIPTVTAVPDNNAQQITVTTPVGAGKATIVVAPDETSDETNTYVINFKAASEALLLLDAIYVNGKIIESPFDPEKSSYDYTYTETRPTITYDSKAGQEVSLLEGKDKVTLVVELGGETKTYVINLTQQKSTNALLNGILLDGTLIDGWNATTYNYVHPLNPGEAEPTITWMKAESAQTVVFGQKDAGVYQIVVLAPSEQDTATYTVTMQPKQYSDATLTKIYRDGTDITTAFNAAGEYNGGTVAFLPTITYEKKVGQNVLISNTTERQQQILVVAQDGTQKTYTLNYEIENDKDVQLSGILVDGAAIKGFSPAQSAYTVKLDERTAQVPAITPQSNIVGQTYIITYGRVNARTTIEVISKDKTKKGYYYIDFEVRPLTNNTLGTLRIYQEALVLDSALDVKQTEHNVIYNPGADLPTVLYTKAEDEQYVEYTRKSGGDTEIKVVAQNGQSQTYKIHFTTAKPTAANILKSLTVNSEAVADLTKDTINVTLPFDATTLPLAYETNFDGQTVIEYNGGINRPTVLVVCANHPDVADKRYVIVPTVEPYSMTGKLTDLQFKGATVPNFQPNVYNYVVNVTAQPTAADFVGTAYNSAAITKSALDNKNKKITLTVASGKTYTVSWYYTNYAPPFEFDWVETDKAYTYSVTLAGTPSAGSTASSSGTKPKGWRVPADYSTGLDYNALVSNFSYQTGIEVLEAGEGALLSTCRSSSMNGSMPGVMTTGKLELKWGINGASSLKTAEDANLGFDFKNTPEQFAFDYSPRSSKGGINQWDAWVIVSDGSNKVKKTYTGNYNTLKTWGTATMDLNLSSIGTVSKANVMICSSAISGTSFDCYGGGTVKTSAIIVQNLRFVYNSLVKTATINGKNATVDNTNKTISVAFSTEDVIVNPLLEVVGQVSDQEQVITWGDEKLEGANVVRTGTLRNYGEDHSYTDYALRITRPASTDATLKSVLWGTETISFTDNKCIKDKTAPFVAMPNIVITPNSVHQTISVAHSNDSLVITVKPEKGDAKKYVICFKEAADSDAKIGLIKTDVTLTPAFNADVTEYSVAVSPKDVDFVKGLFQQVVVKHDADTTRFIVTAADKTTTKTYVIAKEQKATSANLKDFTLDGVAQTIGANDPYQVEIMPKVVLFTRQSATDTVSQAIYADSIVWSVKGTDKTNKYAIVNKNESDHNAYLAGVLVDGDEYDEFRQQTMSYTIPTDSMVDLQFIPANEAQTIVMTLSTEAPKASPKAIRKALPTVPTVTFSIKVTAKDGNTETYSFKLEAPKGNDASLKGIIVGTDTIKEFYADKKDYIYTIPCGSPKTNQPEIPAVTYLTTDPMATVEVEPAAIGDNNAISVTSADGSKTSFYNLALVPQKSTYAELNGIMVDGILVPGFQADRYHYSVQVEPATYHSIEVSSLDKFIDTTIVRSGKTVIINVTAEDQIHTQRYFVELYEVSRSNNATLADLLYYNADSARMISVPEFDPMNNTYTINLAAKDNMPNVQAVPMVNGQTITPKKEGSLVKIDVLAPDSTASNTYVINFAKPLDDNKYLEYIKLNGVKLPDFDSLNFVYNYNLPVGDTIIPTIYAEPATHLEGQKEPDWSRVDSVKMRADIISYAQNGDSVTYTILFNKTLSAADTLLAIRYDNKLIDGFTPQKEDYEVPIASGLSFPDSIEYELADDYQTAKTTLISGDEHAQLYKIEVRAQNGQMKTYTVNFVRELLNITKIDKIKINGVPLPGFDINQFEYSSILPAGTTDLPKVEVETEDSYKQKIDIRPDIDSIATKSLNKKSVITVTAENGDYVIYTIHFPVALSKDTTLNMIFYGGAPLPSFVANVFDYTVELPLGTTNVPQITYLKKEDLQSVDQSCDSLNNWRVFVDVTAEDKAYSHRYTIDFVLAKSDNALLKDIIVGDSLDIINFAPDSMEYFFEVPYEAGRDTAHHLLITPIEAEDGQYINVDSTRVLNFFSVDITVTAPNGDNMKQYKLTYTYKKNPDATLKNLWLGGDSIEGFMTDTLEYDIEFKVGTDSTQYYTPEDVTYLTNDPLAKVNVKIDQDFTIYVVVTAQDTTSTRTYVIRQTTMLSSDNYLADLIIDEVSYRDFDPEKLDYTYYVPIGSTAAPLVDAKPRDPRAMVSIMPNAIDSVTIITCVAENGKRRTYTILFTNSDIDDNISPKASDVLVKRIYGTNKILVASLRKKVHFALYDHAGHLVQYVENIEPANPNDVVTAVDYNGKEQLVDVVSESSGTTITLNNNQIYFYVFFEAGKTKVASGKLIIMN